MSSERTHLLRLLRRVIVVLEDRGLGLTASKVKGILAKFAQSENIKTEFEKLYSVEGFDEFALLLLRFVEDSNRPLPDERVIEFETESLVQSISDEVATGEKNSLLRKLKPERDGFLEAVYGFGRAIEYLKVASYEKGEVKIIDNQSVFSLQQAAISLEQNSREVSNVEVADFGKAVTLFLYHILSEEIFNDERVVKLLTHANLTLQTYIEAHGTQDADSLRHTVELLQTPKSLFRKKETT